MMPKYIRSSLAIAESMLLLPRGHPEAVREALVRIGEALVRRNSNADVRAPAP